MPAAITIRAERADDAAIIRDIVQRTFADVSYSDHREHIMVDRLRETDAYIPALSLLAEITGEAVGHVLLTAAAIVDGAVTHPTLTLAPLSVVPAARAQGVGKALVHAAHARAAALGHGSIVLVGHADYYPQFGYERLCSYPITLPFAAPPENCMIRRLHPAALDGVAGVVRYPAGWLDH